MFLVRKQLDNLLPFFNRPHPYSPWVLRITYAFCKWIFNKRILWQASLRCSEPCLLIIWRKGAGVISISGWNFTSFINNLQCQYFVCRDKYGMLALSPKQRDRFSKWVRPEQLCSETPQVIYAVSSWTIRQVCVAKKCVYVLICGNVNDVW
jgi:hypothetical protein